MDLVVVPAYSIPTKFNICRSVLIKQLVISRSCCPIMCTSEPPKPHNLQSSIRRSANYQRSTFGNDQLQSLHNPYAGDIYIKCADELKEIVKTRLEEEKDPIDLLELIDDLQRLGLSYHFKCQIKQVLISIYTKYDTILQLNQDNLYAKALIFRLFRQHGFNVSQEIFDCFKDKKGVYRASLCEDTKGMLYLYEASYLSKEGENTLEMAREFTKEHLKKSTTVEDQKIDGYLAALVHRSLNIPLYWRPLRSEARWFMDTYEGRTDMNPLVLKLAKFDFNIVQARYHEDLKYLIRWWKDTGVAEKLTYVRDSLVPCYFCTLEVLGEPHSMYSRRMCTKVNMIISVLDDTYDIYGTLDELELFTEAIERWDINEIDHLPYYMKVCFLVLYNFVNEIAYDTLKEQGIHIISYLKKIWTDLCKAFLVEAKWYYNGYKPTLYEYISNALISIGHPTTLLSVYLLVENSINIETLEAICNYHNIVHSSSLITRLANDLGTSSEEFKRGDVPKSLQCYMFETGASEEQAREYIKFLISETWKKFNKERVPKSPFSEALIEMTMNIARTAHCIYELDNGGSNVHSVARKVMATLFFEPILL